MPVFQFSVEKKITILVFSDTKKVPIGAFFAALTDRQIE